MIFLIVGAVVLVALAVLAGIVRAQREDRRRLRDLVDKLSDDLVEQRRSHDDAASRLLADLDRSNLENTDLRAATEMASAECAELVDKLDAAVREGTAASLVLLAQLGQERAEHRQALSAGTPLFDAIATDAADREIRALLEREEPVRR